MKQSRPKKSKLAGKGFYIALAISLVAVGTATAIAISNTLSDLSGDSLELPESSSTDWENSDVVDDVGAAQSDVPKDSSTQATEETASSSGGSATKTKQTAATATFAMPVSGDIINEFSNGELVKSSTLGDWRTHDGIDIRADENTPVKACADGTIIEVTDNSLWGKTIVIEHSDGIFSYYYGLSENVEVKEDQAVAIGDVIGYVGSTNQMEIAEASHLHFGMKNGDEWVNPLSIITNN